MRRGAKPAKAKAEAKPPVARKSPKNEGSRVRDLEKSLAESLERERAKDRALVEALEQQTATAEILRVISSSPSEIQPVFDAIAANAARLCGAVNGLVIRFDGQLLHLAAHHNVDPERLAALRQAYPRPPSRGALSGRSILTRAIVHVPDVAKDPEYTLPAATTIGYRSVLAVPMIHEGVARGTILVAREVVAPFSDTHIALLQTFAAQAVIAIENVRLFKELEARNAELTEALTQQTATSEVLGVISRSPTDIQPVLDTVVESAARLCEAHDASIFLRRDIRLVLAAYHGLIYDASAFARALGTIGGFTLSLDRGTLGGRTVLDARTVHIADVQVEAEEFPEASENARRLGFHTMLSVPLMREGVAIGAIQLPRTEVRLFTERQVALLKTFADQAVIAIENVRLFTELEARNHDLAEALEQQTATSELLKVIGRSTFDLQPVFETLAENAVRLCEAKQATIFRFDGQLFQAVVTHNLTPAQREFVQQNPIAPGRHSGAGRAALERRTIHIHDVQTDPEYTYGDRQLPIRTLLAVPMLRAAELLGMFSIQRDEVRPFTDSQIALMETFADQAAIAIENVRLFKELETRTGELTRSVGELTALGEVSQALSSTLDIETVLDTIVSRASQLVGDAGCSIYEYDEATEHFELRATHHYDADFVEALRAAPLRKGEGLMGRAAEMREPIQIPDITEPGAYQSSVRDTLIRFGYRALLSVPLLREDHIIGSLSFNRKAPGEFPAAIVDVLKTFATQSALAIQNARLFREIADKSAQLEAASRHKSEFLANMSHELRTPLNAIIGFSEVLAQGMFGDINDKQTEYLHDILESGRHLLSLINDILDLSKIEAGRMELELADFDLPSAIENALILVRERASRRGITLGSSIDERLGTICGDERKVKQVLLNLLSNALKFTPEGGRIDVGVGLHDEVAEVSVADTGIGIASADHEAVFEEFRQVGTADKKAEGTGLGLALSRKFIELHGGKIWVNSAVGVGSKFAFTLPLRQ